MTRFLTPAHLTSWAKFAPGVNESAGRKKGSGSTGHGNRYLASVLVKQRSPPQGPTPSSASANDGSPAAEARSGRWSRSAVPSWSSSGTCCATPTPSSKTSERTSTTPGWTSHRGEAAHERRAYLAGMLVRPPLLRIRTPCCVICLRVST